MLHVIDTFVRGFRAHLPRYYCGFLVHKNLWFNHVFHISWWMTVHSQWYGVICHFCAIFIGFTLNWNNLLETLKWWLLNRKWLPVLWSVWHCAQPRLSCVLERSVVRSPLVCIDDIVYWPCCGYFVLLLWSCQLLAVMSQNLQSQLQWYCCIAWWVVL